VLRTTRRLTLLGIAICLASVGLAACGGGSSSSHSDPLAQVGHYTITKAMIGQWMMPMVGEDFFSILTRTAPAGLVAEPADYPACVAALKTLTPIPGSGSSQPQPTDAELEGRCEKLQQAIRYQALTFLVNSYWNINFAASHGITATSREVEEQLQRAKVTEYPTQAQLENYLTSRHRTLQQQLFELKLELLQEKLLHKASAGGQQAASALASELEAQTSPATCSAGNVVEHCKGFKPPGSYPGLPPAAQLQEIAQWRPPPAPVTKPGSGTHGPKISVG
jgi:hypothetical protein